MRTLVISVLLSLLSVQSYATSGFTFNTSSITASGDITTSGVFSGDGSGLTGVLKLTGGTMVNAQIVVRDQDDLFAGAIYGSNPSGYGGYLYLADNFNGGHTSLGDGVGNFLVLNSDYLGVGTLDPQYKLDVNGSFRATTLYGDGSNLTGGFAKLSATQTFTGANSFTGCVSSLLTNRSGITLASGTVVEISPNYDFAVTTTSLNDVMPIGAVQDIDGCADGAVCSVGVQGRCLVRIESTASCSRGYLLATSGTTLGAAQCLTGVIPVGEHNQEIGHALQGGAAGSVIEGMLHFN